MRKLILSAFFVAAATSLFAQKGLDDVQEKISKKKYGEAKEKVDEALKDAKNQSNADAWFYKAQIYNNLAKEKQDTALSTEALTAMKKYFELEAGKEESKRGLKSILENHQTAVDVYSTYFNAGIKNFQSQNWDAAYSNFARTLEAFDYLAKNKITAAPFDTTATLYAGYSAQNAKKLDQAASYYTQLADKKIADTNYVGIYEFLVGYYQQKKDEQNAQKYINLGKSLFPDRDVWVGYELQGLEGDKSKKLARLEELMKQNPQNADLAVEYVVDLFNYTYGKDKPADYTKRQDDLTNAIKRAIELNPNSAYSNYILTQHISNQIYDMQQSKNAIKGTKPEDLKKKQEISKQIDALNEEQFKYATNAYQIYDKMGASIKASEKASFRAVINQLKDYHTAKKQADKVKLYEARLDTVK